MKNFACISQVDAMNAFRTNKKVQFIESNEKLSCEAVVRFPLFIEYCEDQTIVTEIILCCDSLTNIDNTQLSNNC